MQNDDDVLVVENEPAQQKSSDRHYDASILLGALQAMRDGDFNVRLPGNWTGVEGKIADTFNDIAAANSRVARELERVGQELERMGR